MELFLAAIGIFQHDDRVVDHDADGQYQRQQGQVVDREIKEVHHREGRDNGGRNREARNDGGPEVSKKHEDDQDHEAAREEQGLLGFLNRPFDVDRVVVADRQFDAGRNLKLRHQRVDGVGHLDQVGLGLPDQRDADGLLAVEPEPAPVVFGSEFDPGHVAELDELAVHVGHDEVREFLGGFQFAHRPDGELPLIRFDSAGGNLDVPAPDGIDDFRRRQAPGRQCRRFEPNPHGVATFPPNVDAANPGHGLKRGLDEPVGNFGELEKVVVVAGQGDKHERPGVGVLLRDDRLLDFLGQAATDPGDQVSNILGRNLDVPVEIELQRDGGGLL